jgi:UDP-N-acetylmuramyl pentapeptide phosphotransferase/UDP-N-acetylglucosamine-1-phosphate transferase
LFTLVVTAILGLVDDWFNIRGKGKSKGINVRPKFFWLMFFALLGAWWFYFKLGCLDARIDPAGMGCRWWWWWRRRIIVRRCRWRRWICDHDIIGHTK